MGDTGKKAFRLFAGALAAVLAGGAQAQVVERPIAGDPVAIDTGLVAGKGLASGVKAYFGVPFAAPPVRENRWREPQPVAPWKGVWNADRKPPECIQVLRPHNINHYFGEEPTSEDCLYLNLWAPQAAKAGDKRPVLVWIYGGGYTIGSSGMGNYDGEAMARKGVVFVNLNYRVGALGFMAHPELTAETPHHASGDYALLDQVAALQWIARNIDKFGGDPGNVTIMGQSAGAASVSYLQASPLAKGLFHKVVAMSGSAVGQNRTNGLKDGEQTGLKFQEALKAKSLAEMRQVPADRILALQADCQLGCSGNVRVGPVVDGYFLTSSPREAFEKGAQSDVPILVGFTHDDIGNSSALSKTKTAAEYQAKAHELYGDHADGFLKLYPVMTDADVARAAGEVGLEGGMQQGMRNYAIIQAKSGKAPAYVYMFSRKHPYVDDPKIADQDPKTIGAYHTSDVPYWFQNQDVYNWLRPTRNWTPWDRELADDMSNAIIAFARTGDPSIPAVKWPRYDPKHEQLVEFGDAVRVLPMNTKRLDFLASAPAQAALPPTPGRPRD
jgi:para-nitrobenzyl esterase